MNSQHTYHLYDMEIQDINKRKSDVKSFDRLSKVAAFLGVRSGHVPVNKKNRYAHSRFDGKRYAVRMREIYNQK